MHTCRVATIPACVQGFSALKGVFPGRITLSRREPDSTDSPSLRGDTSDAREASTSQSPVDAAGGPESLGSGDAAPEAQPSTSAAPQTFDDSRVRKFDKLLSASMVDLTALQAVRRPFVRAHVQSPEAAPVPHRVRFGANRAAAPLDTHDACPAGGVDGHPAPPETALLAAASKIRAAQRRARSADAAAAAARVCRHGAGVLRHRCPPPLRRRPRRPQAGAPLPPPWRGECDRRSSAGSCRTRGSVACAARCMRAGTRTNEPAR